jgi:hypothetical protein
MVGLQVVMLSAPTSLASIMVIGPHHASVIHVGDSSEVGQREHMVRQGFTRKCWSEFLCLGDGVWNQSGSWHRKRLRRHAKPGGSPLGMRSAGTPPPTPAAGAPPAGPWQEPNWVYSYVNHVGSRPHLVSDNFGRLAAIYWPEPYRPICSSACACGEVGATGHNLRSASSRITRMSVGSSNGRS